MPQCWQGACVWMQWVRYAQHQDLISTNDHAYALNIHHQSFLSDENCCGVRNWSLQAAATCDSCWCCCLLVQPYKAGSARLKLTQCNAVRELSLQSGIAYRQANCLPGGPVYANPGKGCSGSPPADASPPRHLQQAP